MYVGSCEHLGSYMYVGSCVQLGSRVHVRVHTSPMPSSNKVWQISNTCLSPSCKSALSCNTPILLLALVSLSCNRWCIALKIIRSCSDQYLYSPLSTLLTFPLTQSTPPLASISNCLNVLRDFWRSSRLAWSFLYICTWIVILHVTLKHRSTLGSWLLLYICTRSVILRCGVCHPISPPPASLPLSPTILFFFRTTLVWLVSFSTPAKTTSSDKIGWFLCFLTYL